MLAILFSFLLLFLLFLGIGILTLKLGKISVKFFSETLMVGLFTGSIIVLLFAFFTGIHLYIELLLVLLALFGIIYGKNELRYLFSFKKYYFNSRFWGLFVISLFLISFAPFILDHFGYYVPTITVLNQVGIQTGIANIELVLGQNSLWHILESGLDESVDVYLRLNGLLIILYLLYTFEKKHWYLLLFLPFFLLFAQSPSPDLPIYILSLYVIDRWYFEKDPPYYFLFLMGVWAFIIKISAFWLVLFLGLSIFWKVYRKSLAIDGKVVVVGIFLIGLNAYKSYLSSSNLIFPVADTYVNSPWKPDARIIKQSSELALQKSFDFQYSYQEIVQFSPQEKIINWLQLGGFKGVLNMFFCLVFLTFIYWVYKYKKQQYYLLSLIIVLKFVAVFLVSAQQRFMWDVILVMMALMLQNKKWSSAYQLLCSLGLVAVTVFFCFPGQIQKWVPSFALSNMNQGFQPSQLIKPVVYEISFSEEEQVGNVAFRMPEHYPFLYNTPFVALSINDLNYYHSLQIFPQWEGTKIVMKPLSAQELKQIENVIQKKTAE